MSTNLTNSVKSQFYRAYQDLETHKNSQNGKIGVKLGLFQVLKKNFILINKSFNDFKENRSIMCRNTIQRDIHL